MSTKMTNFLHSIQALKHNRASLLPLCPARVLVRGAALKTVLVQLESVVQAWSEYAGANSEETVSKARGVLKQITSGEFVLEIMMSLSVITCSKTSTRLFGLEVSPFPVLWQLWK